MRLREMRLQNRYDTKINAKMYLLPRWLPHQPNAASNSPMIDDQRPAFNSEMARAFTNEINGYLQSLSRFEKSRLKPHTKLAKLRYYRDRYQVIYKWAYAVQQNRIRNHQTDITTGLFYALERFKAEILKHAPKKEPEKPKPNPDKILDQIMREYGISF